ncbi:MAG: hypothetical protein MI861_14165 [Pirellulales bacterium]|nr:hypothetical protein [Pirellulales bacterium]
MGWAFSLPFRSDALSLGYSGGDADSGDGAEGVLPAQQRDRTRTEAEEFRAAAIALDEEFMRQRQERLRKNEVPGKKQVKQHWHQHVKRVQRQLRQIGNPRRGSMEWQEKQELFKSLDDAPRP